MSVKERPQRLEGPRPDKNSAVRRCHCSGQQNTLQSSGEQWEINCAKEEGKKMTRLWAYTDDRTKPTVLQGYPIIVWTWQGIADFIDSL